MVAVGVGPVTVVIVSGGGRCLVSLTTHHRPVMSPTAPREPHVEGRGVRGGGGGRVLREAR